MKLNGQLVRADRLTDGHRAAMFALMDRCYANVTREHFDADLSEKHWVILLTHPESGVVCGFSTQMLLQAMGDGPPAAALFSGDTIVAPEHWGDVALSHVWGNLALALIDAHAAMGRELYWFLISKGYKTYRFLPVFFRTFYPCHDVPTPPRIAGLIERFARRKFGDAYNPVAGIIRAGVGKDRLRAGVADLTPERLRDPHVAFFARANPGHLHGDELCCLAPLTRENFTPAAYRVIRAAPFDTVVEIPALQAVP